MPMVSYEDSGQAVKEMQAVGNLENPLQEAERLYLPVRRNGAGGRQQRVWPRSLHSDINNNDGNTEDYTMFNSRS